MTLLHKIPPIDSCVCCTKMGKVVEISLYLGKKNLKSSLCNRLEKHDDSFYWKHEQVSKSLNIFNEQNIILYYSDWRGFEKYVTLILIVKR